MGRRSSRTTLLLVDVGVEQEGDGKGGFIQSVQSQAMYLLLYLDHQILYINPALMIVASLNNSTSQSGNKY